MFLKGIQYLMNIELLVPLALGIFILFLLFGTPVFSILV